MNKIVLILTLFLILSCGVRTTENLYLLKYIPKDERSFLNKYRSHLPLSYSVQIDEFEVSRLLERNQIIVRESMHKLHYDSKNKWAIKPHKSIRSLITDHIRSYGIFKDCSEEFFTKEPDFFIGGKIHNIEFYSSEDSRFAYLDMEISLKDNIENKLFTYRITKKENLYDKNFVYFVKTISDLINEEMDNFIIKTLDYMLTIEE